MSQNEQKTDLTFVPFGANLAQFDVKSDILDLDNTNIHLLISPDSEIFNHILFHLFLFVGKGGESVWERVGDGRKRYDTYQWKEGKTGKERFGDN